MADANCEWKLRIEIADNPLSDRLTLVVYEDPIGICVHKAEATTHHLLHCPSYTKERMVLLDTIWSINVDLL